MTNPDFTIADVLAWARTKPADGRYSYLDNRNCALCQFLCDTGRADAPLVFPMTSGGTWSDGGRAYAYPAELEPALSDGSVERDWTYGELADRLEELTRWTRADAYMADIESVSA